MDKKGNSVTGVLTSDGHFITPSETKGYSGCLEVTVTDVLGLTYFKKACEATSGKELPEDRVLPLLEKMYKAEHSPIRERKFWVEVKGCPVFVANHFRTHNVGIEHFHLSHRSDRTGVEDTATNRLTPTSFSFMCNAQSLINMARKRLCSKASRETYNVMRLIRDCLSDGVDPALAECLVPECEYRGQCHELYPCTSAIQK